LLDDTEDVNDKATSDQSDSGGGLSSTKGGKKQSMNDGYKAVPEAPTMSDESLFSEDDDDEAFELHEGYNNINNNEGCAESTTPSSSLTATRDVLSFEASALPDGGGPSGKNGGKQKASTDGRKKNKRPRRHVPLTDMRWGYVSATDLVAQPWCEQKLVYSYIPPTVEYEMVPLEEISPAVAAGQQIHQERESELGDQIVIETETKEDRVALQFAQLLECLRAFIFADTGQVLRREIPILGFLPLKSAVDSQPSFSTPGEILANGIIDELRYDVEEGKLTLVELKTRWSPRLPCESQKVGHRLQVMLYQSFYNDLVEGRLSKSKLALHRKLNLARELSASVVEALWWTVGDEVFPVGTINAPFNDATSKYSTDGTASLPKVTLGQVTEALLQTAKAAPRIHHLEIEYLFQKSKEVLGKENVQFDGDWLVKHSIGAAEFWLGSRPEPKGVDIEDAWKCGMCEFAQDCQWRLKRASETDSIEN